MNGVHETWQFIMTNTGAVYKNDSVNYGLVLRNHVDGVCTYATIWWCGGDKIRVGATSLLLCSCSYRSATDIATSVRLAVASKYRYTTVQYLLVGGGGGGWGRR